MPKNTFIKAVAHDKAWDEDGMRWCSKCNDYQPADDFRVANNKLDGWRALHSYCNAHSRSDARSLAGTAKTCTSCGMTGIRGVDFESKGAKGWKSVCTPCKQYKSRESVWRSKGIDPQEARALLKVHSGLCDCCGKRIEKRTTVDHCHETGKIRGILCMPCNTAIGKLGDNLEGVRNAIRYLEAFEECQYGG